jgi:hypothetical protein
MSDSAWSVAYRGVVSYRVSLILALVGASLAFLGGGMGTALLTGGAWLAFIAGLIGGIGILLFAFGVPWAKPAKTHAIIAAVLVAVAAMLALSQVDSTPSLSYRAYERRELIQLLAVLFSAATTVFFLWSWRCSAEALSDAEAANRSGQAMLAGGIYGTLSVLQQLESFERSAVLRLAALVGILALLITTWRAAKALEAALFAQQY